MIQAGGFRKTPAGAPRLGDNALGDRGQRQKRCVAGLAGAAPVGQDNVGLVRG